MSFQDRPKVKTIPKSYDLRQSKEQARTSLLINSSFNIGYEEKTPNKQITEDVLKKVSETIVSLHSALVPKTQNHQIYRDLSQEEQKMLKSVQDNQLIHTILAGVLAIDSCLKYVYRQQTYVVSSLMKGLTICLGNYKKIQEQFLSANQGRISQNFLKFYDSLKLIIGEIHKIPAAKLKRNQIDRHNELICKSQMNDELLNTLHRQQNLLFSLLAQQNNTLRIKLNALQKQLSEVGKFKIQKSKIMRSTRNMQQNQKKKRDSQNILTDTAQSMKGFQQQFMIRQLKEEIHEKNDIILRMNDQFTLQIQKYQKVFKRLEQENKLLKKYNDVDTAYILQELQYEVQMLRDEKRNDQKIINQIMNQMDRMSWNRNQSESDPSQIHTNDLKSRYDPKSNPSQKFKQLRSYEPKRGRIPSISPTNRQQNAINRYFSPNIQNKQESGRQFYHRMALNDRKQRMVKRDNSPRFGNGGDSNSYENIKERISRSKIAGQQYVGQMPKQSRQFREESGQMRRSQCKRGLIIKDSREKFQLNRLKKEMRRSKFLNQQMNYM